MSEIKNIFVGNSHDWEVKTMEHLQQRIRELESYKADWQSIAGKANLKALIARLDEAEEVMAIGHDWGHQQNCDLVLMGDRGECDCVVAGAKKYFTKHRPSDSGRVE